MLSFGNSFNSRFQHFRLWQSCICLPVWLSFLFPTILTSYLSMITASANQRVSISQMVGVLGFEPRTSSLSGTRSNQLSYTPICGASYSFLQVNPVAPTPIVIYWWSLRDSNPWHSACKADALANWAKAPVIRSLKLPMLIHTVQMSTSCPQKTE